MRYSPDKIFTLKVSTSQSNIKSRPNHDAAHLQPNQCSYQVSSSYTLPFLRYIPDKNFPATRQPILTPWVKTLPQKPLKSVGKNQNMDLAMTNTVQSSVKMEPIEPVFREGRLKDSLNYYTRGIWVF